MPVILPDGHPAIELLKAEGISVFSSSEAFSRPRIRVALSNTMSNPEETDTQFARSLSHSDHYVEITSFSPFQRFDKSRKLLSRYKNVDHSTLDAATQKEIAKAYHRLTFHQPLRAIKDDNFDGVIMAGFGASKLPLRQSTAENPDGVEFYDEFMDLVNHIYKNNIPTLATCWSAHAVLNRHHGVDRIVNTTKLTGIFSVAVVAPNDPVVKNLGPEFPLPVSRFGTSNEQQIISNPNLAILATSEQTGAALVREANGPFIFMTGHPEYLPDTHKKEFLRDLVKGLRELISRTKENAPAQIQNALRELNENAESPPSHLKEVLEELKRNNIHVPLPEFYNVYSPQHTWDRANRTFYPNVMDIFASVSGKPYIVAHPQTSTNYSQTLEYSELTQ